MSAKHTKGPWVHSKDGALKDNQTIIAHVGGSLHDTGNFRETIANARLIAAAPDLLDALYACASLLHDKPEHHEALMMARAAIAKAEGRS